jgi:hypothetical protein
MLYLQVIHRLREHGRWSDWIFRRGLNVELWRSTSLSSDSGLGQSRQEIKEGRTQRAQLVCWLSVVGAVQLGVESGRFPAAL